VTLGIAGELWVGASIALINGKLRTKNEELRSKSGQLIALLTEEAGDAKTSAEDAGLASSRAERSATLANDAARRALDEDIKAEAETQRLHQQGQSLQATLNEEHRKRMELEKTVAPRLIWDVSVFVPPHGSISTVDVLRKFAGMSVIIESIPDWEARRAAGNLAQLLKDAGLLIERTDVAEKDLPDGVTVDAYTPSDDPKKREEYMRLADWHKSADAADEIIAFLEANDWGVKWGLSAPDELRIDEVRIRVGFKPAPYFQPAMAKSGGQLLSLEQEKVEEIRNHIKHVLSEAGQEALRHPKNQGSQ